MNDTHTPGPNDDSPLVQMMVSLSGASAAAHETEPPGASPVSVQAGHEPDRFQVLGILYVPLFVTAIVLLAFVFISAIFFGLVRQPSGHPIANPQAAELNKPELNKRFARTSSTDPQPLDGRPDTGVPQPRLEYLKQTGHDGPFDDPDHFRSKLPTAEGNFPEYRPEFLRPENYVDPASGHKVLVEYRWADQEKRTVRVPISEAIKMVVAQKKLPTKKDDKGQPVKGPSATSEDRAKLSNAGFGGTGAGSSIAPKMHGD